MNHLNVKTGDGGHWNEHLTDPLLVDKRTRAFQKGVVEAMCSKNESI